jgi:hypothetical protein
MVAEPGLAPAACCASRLTCSASRGVPVFSLDGLIERSNDLLIANQTRSSVATFESRYAARDDGGSVLLLLLACNGEGERVSQKIWDYGRRSLEERWRANFERVPQYSRGCRTFPQPAPGRLQVHRFVVPSALPG